MKEGWIYRRIGDVCTVIGGATPKTEVKEFWGGNNYWITPADLDGRKYQGATPRTITDAAVEKTNLQLLPVGTVLLSSRAPIGKVAITTVPMYCNQGFKNIICPDSLLNEFVYWFLFYNKDYLNSLGTGATFKEISKKTTESVLLPVPPFAEQERIVAELDLLQGIIDKQKAQLKELDALAQSIFYDMFEKRDDNVCKIIDLCKTPDDIKCGPFGTQLSKEEYQTAGVAVWGIPQVNSLFRVPPTDFVTAEKAKALASFSVIPGDIVMSRKGNVGQCAVFPSSFPEGIIHSDVLRIRLEKDKMDSVFLMYQLHLSDTIKRQILSVSSGAIMPGINVGKLKQISVSVPPLSLQQSFAEKIEAIERQKASINASIAETQKLFDYTMDKYFG